MKVAVLLFVALNFPGAALASRSLTVPPLTQETAHGGLLTAPDGVNKMTCVTADMTGPGSYENNDGGVVSVNQRYKIAFQNLSSTNQNVTISILPGTKMSGSHSRGNGDRIPDTANTPREINSAVPISFTLSPSGTPGSSSVQDVNFTSNATASNISPPDPGVTCTGAPQVCLYQQSTLILSLTIAEDRGAVLANITSSSHRCSGYIDHYIQPPIGFQVNGGRPF